MGRVLLKLHALVEVLEQKGLVAADELLAKARELDAADGEQDGVLNPALFRTEEEQRRHVSPRAYLIELEKNAVSPKEFLANLEDRDETES